MSDFADTVTDPRKNELLSVALEGRGAFRRFKDTLHRVGLVDEWYDFKHKAYVELAREWCEGNGIEYIDTTKKPEQNPSRSSECSEDVTVMPFVQKIAEDAAGVMHEALGCSESAPV